MSDSSTVGATLRRARTSRKLTITDAAAHTRIRSEQLTALEDDDYARLGAPVYAIGFIRSYARYLGADPEPLALAYRRAHVDVDEGLAASLPQPVVRPPRSGPLKAGALAVGVLLVVLGLPRLATPPDPAVDVAGSPSGAVEPAAPPQAREVSVERGPVALPDASVPSGAGAQAATDAGEVTPVEASDLIVDVSVSGGESWLRVVVDGETTFEGVEGDGATLTVTAKQQVMVRTGNAGAVLLAVNGRSEGPAGLPGQVREITFGADGERL